MIKSFILTRSFNQHLQVSFVLQKFQNCLWYLTWIRLSYKYTGHVNFTFNLTDLLSINKLELIDYKYYVLPEIGLCSQWQLMNYLRCNVVRCTTERAGTHLPINVLLAHPEVCNLNVAIFVKQNVVQLQVSVNRAVNATLWTQTTNNSCAAFLNNKTVALHSAARKV